MALCRYFKRGAGYGTGFLVDMLGVSADSVLEQAGYDDEDVLAVMHRIAELTDEEIEAVADTPL